MEPSNERTIATTAPTKAQSRPKKPKNNNNNSGSSSGRQTQGQQSAKLRGLPKDSVEVRISKTLSWLLRHGAQSQGLTVRPDGFIKVSDVLVHPKLAGQSVDLTGLQEIVKADVKQRYTLIEEPGEAAEAATVWWIRANQGHSIKDVKIEMKPVTSLSDIPTGVAIHGTTREAWKSISTQGLSKMSRNHIHLAQGVAGDNVVSGMRKSSQILIFIDVQQALDDGILFFLSDNGVVLTEGNGTGVLLPKYFSKVQDAKGEVLLQAT